MTQSFEDLNLNATLIEALAKQSITKPTEIQYKAIPFAKQNMDLIAQSETGTGKTLAYLLPLFEKLNVASREMQALILVPTHELAIQIQRQIERLSQNSDFKVTSMPIIGDVNITRQIEKLKDKPHIVVGTTGRILELIKKKKISAHTVKTIVIDEADRLLDDNNVENVMAVIKSTLKERQLMMFSATISQKSIAKAKDIMKNPEIIKGEEKSTVPESIEHLYFMAEQRDKIDVLRKLVRILDPQKALVFVGKSDESDIVAMKLQYHGLKAESIHGSNIKIDRKKAMDGIRTGTLQLLIASDIAARGLDIEGITHIFHLNLPEDPMDYLHRAGRTGRAGNIGVSVSIASQRELPLITAYENALKIKILPRDMYKGNIMESKGGRPKGTSNRPAGNRSSVKGGK